jgi:hypothetical protein
MLPSPGSVGGRGRGRAEPQVPTEPGCDSGGFDRVSRPRGMRTARSREVEYSEMVTNAVSRPWSPESSQGAVVCSLAGVRYSVKDVRRLVGSAADGATVRHLKG